MKRWHQEVNKSKQNKKQLIDTLDKSSPDNVKYCQLGRYRKRRGLDCGIPKCPVCHGDKFVNKTHKKIPTFKQKITKKEQTDDIQEYLLTNLYQKE